MHTTNFDLSIEELSKIEGTASVDVKVRNGELTECKFAITEMRRFFTESVRGKPATVVPSLLARICGTCSNAHLIASTIAVEKALEIEISEQSKLLRKLLYNGLMIRDHGLHLYVFVLPDLFNRDSILKFDENNPEEHQLLHDTFTVKEAGNKLGSITGGRSVHAPFVKPGGMSVIPKKDQLLEIIPLLLNARKASLNLLKVFMNCSWNLIRDKKYLAMKNSNYSYFEGSICTEDDFCVIPSEYEKNLEKVRFEHSQASAYRFHGQTYMVGALARMNINKNSLLESVKNDCSEALKKFPSDNIYNNNIAQIIEIVQAIDESIKLINSYEGKEEKPVDLVFKDATGYGIIEAPRGTLYHKLDVQADGTIKHARIIVPTAQNQIDIQESIETYVRSNLDKPKEEIEKSIETIVRAYDPCMSCATHFLKIKWK